MDAGVRVRQRRTGRVTVGPEGAPRAAFQQVERDCSTAREDSQGEEMVSLRWWVERFEVRVRDGYGPGERYAPPALDRFNSFGRFVSLGITRILE